MKKLEIYLRSGLRLDINNPKITVEEIQKKLNDVGTVRFDVKNESFVIRIEDIEAICMVDK
jgi:hypothetical protein